MQQDYNEESFKKGEQFEKYVEEVIFPDAHYEVIYKTSDSEQNRRRFVKKSLEPDFQFKCRVTGKEFCVEAKWRAKPYKDVYQVLSEKQIQSFPSLNCILQRGQFLSLLVMEAKPLNQIMLVSSLWVK